MSIAAVILAAGKGTRMKSELPKVLVPVNGKPMIRYVLETVHACDIQKNVIVVGYRADRVQAELNDFPANFVRQEPQNGTGHAVLQAEPVLADFPGEVVVLYGDVPFIKPETLQTLIRQHRENGATASILTVDMPDPTRYGRIVRNSDGTVHRIVEHADANDEILKIKEINTGIICFNAVDLFEALQHIDPQNEQGELYLTDTIGIFTHDDKRVIAVKIEDPFEVMGLDTPEKVAQAETHLTS